MFRDHSLLLLPHLLHEGASLPTCNEVGAEAVRAHATRVATCGVRNEIMVRQPLDHWRQVPEDNEVSIHVDTAVVVDQSVSLHRRMMTASHGVRKAGSVGRCAVSLRDHFVPYAKPISQAINQSNPCTMPHPCMKQDLLGTMSTSQTWAHLSGNLDGGK